MDEFTERVILTPTLEGLAPRVRVKNAARTRCEVHGSEFSREEGYLHISGTSCVRMVCGSPEHDPDENVLGWYVVPVLA